MDIKGKVSVITGGASGIGFATAQRLAAAGSRLVLADIEPGALDRAAAGLVPNVGLGPYCVAKYGVVALAEVLHRELRPNNIGVSVLCPMRVSTNIGSSERNRPAELGGPDASPRVAEQGEDNRDMAGRV